MLRPWWMPYIPVCDKRNNLLRNVPFCKDRKPIESISRASDSYIWRHSIQTMVPLYAPASRCLLDLFKRRKPIEFICGCTNYAG